MGFGFGWELGRAWPLCVSTAIMQGPPSAGPLAYRSRELGLPAAQAAPLSQVTRCWVLFHCRAV